MRVWQVAVTFTYQSFEGSAIPMEVYVNLLVGLYQNYYNWYGTVPGTANMNIYANTNIDGLTVTSGIVMTEFSPPPFPPSVRLMSNESIESSQGVRNLSGQFD